MMAKETDDNETTVVSRQQYSKSFNTEAYLMDFYTRVEEPAMQMVLSFLPNIAQRLNAFKTLLDFGAGPTIHVAAIFRNKAKEIYLADYLPQNRQELERWLCERSTFDWSETLKKIANAEGQSWQHIEDMEKVTRTKIKGIFHCDCHNIDSVSAPEVLKRNFDVVSTMMCIEYCSSTLDEYQKALKNVVNQLRPGGFFIIGGVLEETWCSFGGKKFPCFYVTKEVLLSTLRNCKLMVDDPLCTTSYNINGMYLICTQKPNKMHDV